MKNRLEWVNKRIRAAFPPRSGSGLAELTIDNLWSEAQGQQLCISSFRSLFSETQEELTIGVEEMVAILIESNAARVSVFYS